MGQIQFIGKRKQTVCIVGLHPSDLVHSRLTVRSSGEFHYQVRILCSSSGGIVTHPMTANASSQLMARKFPRTTGVPDFCSHCIQDIFQKFRANGYNAIRYVKLIATKVPVLVRRSPLCVVYTSFGATTPRLVTLTILTRPEKMSS